MGEPEAAFVGIGGNVGDVARTLCRAVRRLDETSEVTVAEASPVYRTPPVGPVEQPPFLNAVVRVEACLGPRALLDRLLAVERALGRQRAVKWGPRTLDLDLLFYGDRVIDGPGLRVPHPHAHERAFVLVPLCDLHPAGQHPVLKTSFQSLLSGVDRSGVRRVPELRLVTVRL